GNSYAEGRNSGFFKPLTVMDYCVLRCFGRLVLEGRQVCASASQASEYVGWQYLRRITVFRSL
ncbi:MAG: hypothetical protein AAGE92_16320, partial [Cyanobacteria bacterium P01_G01_bin.4]